MSDALDETLARTAARLLVGRAGPALRTATALALRADHAAARDAVRTELDWRTHFTRSDLFEIATAARSKDEYLLRPDLGRTLPELARETLCRECPRGADVQIVLGDGLSSAAVERNGPALLESLTHACEKRGWSVGRPFVVRYARVGVMNGIGDVLVPQTVALLIGERPGLATAESLSAYLAYRPTLGHTDAQRNLISNIHARGVAIAEAAERIAGLLATMTAVGSSGTMVKEGSEVSAVCG